MSPKLDATISTIKMASALIDEITKNGKAFVDTQDDDARQKAIVAASALIQELENPLEQLARIGWGEPSRTAALRTAFELGLLKKLGTDALSSEQLAEGTPASSGLIGKLNLVG